MCGILGGYKSEGWRDRKPIDIGLNRMEHRGPDDLGLYMKETIALGHRRLSVIDIQGGSQPMGNEDGTIWIVFNGEIYNHRELRKSLERKKHEFRTDSDTEAIIHLYEEYGPKCVEKLIGMFAFALHDGRSDELFLARDRMGQKPLYYVRQNRDFYFSSEIAPLFDIAPIPKRPNMSAIRNYLDLGYIPAPDSGFEVVRKLPPAHWMTVSQGNIKQIRQYWEPKFEPKLKITREDAAQKIRELFLEATRCRLLSDVPLGAFLSGGVDSSVLVSAMVRVSSRKVKTFTIGLEDAKWDETPYARAVAKYLGTEHEEHVVRPDAMETLPELVDAFGEPFADQSAIPTYCAARCARQEITVALSGDGGDESFGGYRRYQQLARAHWLEKYHLTTPWKAARKTSLWFDRRIKRRKSSAFPKTPADRALLASHSARYHELIRLFSEEWIENLLGPASELDFNPVDAAYETAPKERHPIDRMISTDLRNYLPYMINNKVDIASMLNSLECRSPFLDHRIVEFMASLPTSFKVHPWRGGKPLLKRAFGKWLPDNVFSRKKRGFSVPLGDWFRGPPDMMFRDMVMNDREFQRRISPDGIYRLYREHKDGTADHGNRLYALLFLSLWVKRFRVDW